MEIDGAVTGETANSVASMQNAVTMSGGSSQRLILRHTAEITGSLAAQNTDNATLELVAAPLTTGAAIPVLDLQMIRGFTSLLKSGETRWDVSGTQNAKQIFSSAEVRDGTLGFDNINFVMEENAFFNIGARGTLELAGANSIGGGLDNDGTLSFAQGSTSHSLTIDGDYQGDGRLVFNIDFATGSANKLVVRGEASGSSSVDLRAIGNVPQDNPTIGSLIEVKSGTPEESTFVAGQAIAGAFLFDLAYDGAGNWSVEKTGSSPLVPTFESIADTLQEVADLPSMEDRLGARPDDNDPWMEWCLWGYTGSDNAEVVTSQSWSGASRYEIRDARTRFGMDVPLAFNSMEQIMGAPLFIGANVSMGEASSSIKSDAGNGRMALDGFTGALTASWLPSEGFYADAQLQYASFTSDLAADGLLLVADNAANSMSASAETGYRFIMSETGMTLTPQAQLIWSEVHFDDFTGPNGEQVSLSDGRILTGRLGVSLNKTWSWVEGERGSISGDINLRAPIDGTTAAEVSGVKLASEMEVPLVDLGVGFTYHFDEGSYALFGEAGSEQGGVEEYRANLGMRIGF